MRKLGTWWPDLTVAPSGYPADFDNFLQFGDCIVRSGGVAGHRCPR